MTAGVPFIDTTSGAYKYQGTSGTPAVLALADGTVHLVPLIHPFTGSTGFQSVAVTTFQGIGTISFDPSALFTTNGKVTRALKFEAILEATPTVTIEVRLYNLTAGSVVSGSTLSSSVNTPTYVSATLTAGSELPNSNQLYEVQLRISSPASPIGSDRAICKLAQLVSTWS